MSATIRRPTPHTPSTSCRWRSGPPSCTWSSSGRPGAYVRVHLRGVDVPLAGKLGKKSVAGVSPEGHDLFLEESWELDPDAWFDRASPSTAGLWIAGDQIALVEIFHGLAR